MSYTGKNTMHDPVESIGIVVPARNEIERIAACLDSLHPFRYAGDSIVVIDACSRDDTARIAEEMGFTVMQSPKSGRSDAIAFGVESLLQADGRLRAIVIAHADMVFPTGAREALVNGLRNHPDAPGGVFGHRIEHPGGCYRLLEWGNAFRARILQLPYGDQAQFFRPSRLDNAGGFPEVNRLEDIELALRLRSLGRLLYLDCPVLISARHWKEGIVRVTLRNWLVAARYLVQRRTRSATA